MYMRKYLLIASIVAATGVAPASAEDFTGPRAEVLIGWDQLRFDLDDFGESGRTKPSNLGYGFAIGYDSLVSPGIIGGVEAAINLSGGDYMFGDETAGGGFHARRDLSLSGRLGTQISQNALLYGKVGYSNFRTRLVETAEGVDSSRLKNLDGILLGVGAEVAINPKTYIKSEYRYTNYEDGIVRNDVLTGIGLRF